MLALVWATRASLAPAEEAKAEAEAVSATEPAPTGRVEAAALLNESQWSVELHRLFTREPEPPIADTLRFTGGQLTSERFAPSGYAPGPFTLSIGPAGRPVWEAAQLSQQDGIILWRGELDRDTIRGTVSRLPLDGSTEDFRFEGKEILASSAPPTDTPPSDDLSLPDDSTPAETPSAG
jgi:hypothetical protein